MIGSIGLPEILFVLVLALLVFGPKRLPQVGRTLGKALGEFRRATNDLKRTVDNELRADLISGEDKAPPTPSVGGAQTSSSAGSVAIAGAAAAVTETDDDHGDDDADAEEE